jgi:hypothetical protein
LFPVHTHPPETYDSYQVGFFAEVKEHITRHGGSIPFAYKAARLAGCLIFTVLCLATLIQENDIESHLFGKWGKKPKKKHSGRSEISEREWLQISMSISAVRFFIYQFLLQLSETGQLYASLLALISVLAKPRWSKLVTRHLILLLLVIFGVYVYRDLLPLTTFMMVPKDTSEGLILPAKVLVLVFTAVAIPLLIPRQYVPVDPRVILLANKTNDFLFFVGIGSDGGTESRTDSFDPFSRDLYILRSDHLTCLPNPSLAV